MQIKKIMSLLMIAVIGGSIVGCGSQAKTDNTIEHPTHEAVSDIAPVQLWDAPTENIVSKLTKVNIKFDDSNYSISKKLGANVNLAVNVTKYDGTLYIRNDSTAETAKHPFYFVSDDSVNMNLLSNIYDKTLIHDAVAQDLYKYISDGYTNDYEFVDVYAGVTDMGYQGVYLLKDDITSDDFDDNQLLMRLDNKIYYDDSDNGEENVDWFWIDNANESIAVETGKHTKEQTEEMKSDMEHIFDVLINGSYSDVLNVMDIDSFIKGFIVEELVKDQNISQNMYFYLEDGKLYYATLADCDLSFGSGELTAADEDFISTNNFIFSGLWRFSEFKRAYIEYFNNNADDLEKYMLSDIDNLMSDYHDNFENDYVKWEIYYNYCDADMKGENLSYDAQIKYMKNWISSRFNFLHTELNSYNVDVEG